MNILTIFIILSVVNVIFSTIRSILTIKGNKWVASFVSASYYAFYNIVLIYTVMDFEMWQKCIITFGANLLGVWLVKFIEEKMKKDKLWVFSATCNKDFDTLEKVINGLKQFNIKLVYNEIVKDKLYTLNIYSNTQKESELIEKVLKTYEIKYCAYETKVVG